MKFPRLSATLVAFVVAMPLILSAQSTWTGALNGAWEEEGNWLGSSPPANAASADVVMTGHTNTSLTLAAPWTLGLLTFDSGAGDFTFGGASLTLASGLQVLAGAHTFNNAVHFGSTQAVNVKSGASLAFAGGGSGFLDFNPLADPDGADDPTYAGTLALNGASAFDTIYVSGGLLRINAATSAGQLSLIGSGAAELNTSGAINDALIALMQNGTLTLNADHAFTDAAVWFYALGDGPGGTIDLNGHDVTINGVLSFNYGGTAAESGWIVNTGAEAANVTFEIYGAHVFAGNTSNTGGGALTVVKEGSGVLVLGSNADAEWDEPGSVLGHTGATIINAGTLLVNGNLTASTVTVNDGGTLAGVGTMNEVVVETGGTVTAQDYGEVGTMTVERLTLNAGAALAFHLTDATGGAGTGWTLIEVSDVLSLSATAGSLTLSIDAGDFDESNEPLNFNPTQHYSFTIARFGTVNGFSPAAFSLLVGDAEAFAGGSWSVSQAGDELRLNYTAIPEPGTIAAVIGGLALAFAFRRRQARQRVF